MCTRINTKPFSPQDNNTYTVEIGGSFESEKDLLRIFLEQVMYELELAIAKMIGLVRMEYLGKDTRPVLAPFKKSHFAFPTVYVKIKLQEK